MQQLAGRLRHVHREVGERLDPAEVGCLRRSGLVGFVELGNGGQRGFLLPLKVVVALAECTGERVVRVPFAGLLHDRVLLARDGGQELLLTCPLGLPLPAGGVIDATEVLFEDRSPFGAEEPVGVEPANGFQEFVFAHPDRRRQTGVKIGLALIVLARPAEVVDDLLVLHVTEHSSPAAVNYPPTEDVLPLGLGMAVQRVPVA
ncbi:hypothetical protein ACFFTO_20645 [Amycolatopsis plumensis]|uniref:Uncharacterized protein n=1 Tax=Amycolatopsis plumensis TaxID=236508 RepID=A0ABV5U5F7_9PSEU